MKITKSLVESILVDDIPSLDPITIVLDRIGEGHAQVTIKCYDKSWTAYWGSMGGSVEKFFSRVNTPYLVNCFDRGIRSYSENKDTDAMQEVFINKMRNLILEKRKDDCISKQEARLAWKEVLSINFECIIPEHDHECFNWDIENWSVDPCIWKPVFADYYMDDEYYKEEFQQWLWENVPFQYEPNYNYEYLCRIVDVVKEVLGEE